MNVRNVILRKNKTFGFEFVTVALEWTLIKRQFGLPCLREDIQCDFGKNSIEMDQTTKVAWSNPESHEVQDEWILS